MMKYILNFASMGNYRIGFVREIQRKLQGGLAIYSGTEASDLSIKTLQPDEVDFVPLRNRFFGNGFLIQSIPLLTFLKADVLLMDLNPRFLHVWLVLLLRRVLGKRTLLWGHAWSAAGKGSRSDRIRGWQRSLGSGLVTYTRTQAEEVRAANPKIATYPAPNALYAIEQMRFEPDTVRKTVLYVGRLVDKKKPEELIKAFLAIAGEIDPAIRLLMVGDGPARKALEQQVDAAGMRGRVSFAGHVDDIEALRAYYAESLFSVSPGYVGLSITQSFSFGVPMLISRNEIHSPEIEAAIEGENCEFFEYGEAGAFASALLRMVEHAGHWKTRGPAIVKSCQERYSVESMAAGVIAALKGD